MHGSNRLGGNSLSDLLVFGRRAGLGAADYVRALSERPTVSEEAVDDAAKLALAPFEAATNGEAPENPYTLQLDLQDTMNTLVGIIRKADEVDRGARQARASCASGTSTCRSRAAGSSTRAGTWPSTCATCCWSASAWPRRRWSAPRAAAATPATTTRRWTRTGARRCWSAAPKVTTAGARRQRSPREDQIPMRQDLLELFELDELEKYFTPKSWPSTRNGELMATRRTCGSGAATTTAARCRTTPSRSTRARWCSTSSTGCSRPRPPTSRCGGTARRASAGRARRRSTAGRGCCA